MPKPKKNKNVSFKALRLLPECPPELAKDVEPFLTGILHEPHEDTPRLVLADWLDEHNSACDAFSLRAELIRNGCAINSVVGLPSLEVGGIDVKSYPVSTYDLFLRELELMKCLTDRQYGGWFTESHRHDIHSRLGCVRTVDDERRSVPAVMVDRGFPGCVWSPLGVMCSSDRYYEKLPLTVWHVPEFEPVKLMRRTTRDYWWCWSVADDYLGTADQWMFRLPRTIFSMFLSSKPGLIYKHETQSHHHILGYRTREEARRDLSEVMARVAYCSRGSNECLADFFAPRKVSDNPALTVLSLGGALEVSRHWLGTANSDRDVLAVDAELLRRFLHGTGFTFVEGLDYPLDYYRDDDDGTDVNMADLAADLGEEGSAT